MATSTRMRSRTAPFVVLSVGLVTLGPLACGQGHAPTLAGAELYPTDGAERYAAALDTWTREHRVYDVFETVLILKGTLLTPSFQEAYGLELARRQVQPAAERDATVEKALSDVSSEVRVLFTASSPLHSRLRLHRTDSVWKARLIDGEGRSAPPSLVQPYAHLSRLEPSILFPYITRWDEAYLAHFPLHPDGAETPFLGGTNRELIFQLAGQPGAGELRWSVDPEAVRSERPLPVPPLPPPDPSTPTPAVEAL